MSRDDTRSDERNSIMSSSFVIHPRYDVQRSPLLKPLYRYSNYILFAKHNHLVAAIIAQK